MTGTGGWKILGIGLGLGLGLILCPNQSLASTPALTQSAIIQCNSWVGSACQYWKTFDLGGNLVQTKLCTSWNGSSCGSWSIYGGIPNSMLEHSGITINGQEVQLGGSINISTGDSFRLVTGNTTVLAGDNNLFVDTTAGNVVVTYPVALTNRVVIWKISSDNNAVIISDDSSDYLAVLVTGNQAFAAVAGDGTNVHAGYVQ